MDSSINATALANVPVPSPSPVLPIELWSAITAHVAAPLTQFVSSPTAALAANPSKTYTARKALLRLAHLNKAAYAAARPYLYGTLLIALRSKADHDDYSYPLLLQEEEEFEHCSKVIEHKNHNYLIRREQLAAMGRVFPGWCDKLEDGETCSEAHKDRDRRIAEVTQVPEVFPFVVLDGKLYLASLAANEKVRTDLDDGERAIAKSVASLLHDDVDNDSVAVLIRNGLVLVPYPLHLVTSLHLRTGPVDPMVWLATGTDPDRPDPYYDWKIKLPFLFAIPPEQLCSMTLAIRPEHAFDFLCDQLLWAFPHVRTLDMMPNARPYYNRFNYPIRLRPPIQNAYLFQMGRVWDSNLLPWLFGGKPLRRLEIYGEHPWTHKDWEGVFNNATLETLVTDFLTDGDTDGPIPLQAPRLRSWTTNQSLALDVFACRGSDSAAKDKTSCMANPAFPALEELTIIVTACGEFSNKGLPEDYSQVPALPYHRMAKSLRTFSVARKLYDEYSWAFIRANVLNDLLTLPLLKVLELPHVLPFDESPFLTDITCSNLTTLDINLRLFLSLFSSVSFPRLTSLTLAGEYMPQDQHQMSSNVWLQLACSPLGQQLTHFGWRLIPINVSYARSFVFPSTSPPLPRLESMDLFTSLGHVDVTHLPAIVPNLRSARLDVDHLAGLSHLLAHPQLCSLTLGGMSCPTMLEQLLSHRFPANFGLKLRPRDNVGVYGGLQSVVGDTNARVCLRKDMTLVYDRQRNGNTWAKLGQHGLDAMRRGQVQHIKLVSTGTWGPRDVRRILLALKRIACDWNGVKVSVARHGIAEQGKGQTVSEMPQGVAALVRGLKKLGHGEIVGEVEWVDSIDSGCASWWDHVATCCGEDNVPEGAVE